MKKTLLYKTFLFAFMGLCLQSCFVAKNYDRPDLETDSLYRTSQVPTDSSSMATISWRAMFKDPFLSAYIEEGLQKNLDIRIALQQINAAEAYLKQGKAGYLPSLSAKGSAMQQNASENGQFSGISQGSINLYEFSTALSWEADIWGKIRSNKRATEAGYLQTMAAHKAVKSQLVAQIASTYYQLLALDRQKEITEKTITNRENSLETIKALKEAGNVTQVAVDQTSAQLYNAQALLIDIEKNIFRTENTLSLLLARPSQNIERGDLTAQTLGEELQLGIPSLLLRNRPDVIAAEYQFVNTFELTNVAKSNFYPSFTLTGTAGFQSLDFKNWFDSSSLFSSLLGGLTQPIFNNRKIRTQYEVALAQKEQALANFEKTVLIAGQEVSNALFEYTSEVKKYAYRNNEVQALRTAESNSEVLLNNGFGTYLDLLTARQNALNAEINLIENQLQQLQSKVALYKALGGGWQ
ncbi:efflux transporter, outer membrane factor (OMF) lipoprotein, NodT family [Arenibacter nanhaiticus]|uniref:Efflux transporter, outer membrane factor (OMF) lipoprotein, NodT family n=1 Tax=Arenibacter nanhaiticus TaxID=558155 RepID=A0A1M6CYW2_9FLAO|nr:efflux transporter outer membrane subunit [Arenibacter nanhaiticus]SHI66159.1 efflux transporter, outer membrane factor (OMF) lipoprotein, NodT family [Arenibacter nanhaiticus]